jgi:hypothetical protein
MDAEYPAAHLKFVNLTVPFEAATQAAFVGGHHQGVYPYVAFLLEGAA